MKTCFKCNQVKYLSEFYKCSTNRDGYQNKCKECERIYRQKNKKHIQNYSKQYYLKNRKRINFRIKKYKQKNIEWLREYHRKYTKTPQGKSVRDKASKNYYEKYPDRYMAKNLLNNAIKSGKVKKPIHCSVCKQEFHTLHGHHKDYDEPLNVVWVCVKCHTNLHRKHIKCAV